MKNSYVQGLIRILISAFILIAVFACQQTKVPEKPNILFIFTDDQQWNTIHALGNSHIHTPNLDKLTEGAFIFNNTYCFGGNTAAVCIPSRNMLMSGRTFFQFEADCQRIAATGAEPRRKHFANPDWPTIPKVMKAAGYETFYREKSGKSNNPVIRSQFDHYADIHQVNALRTGRPANKIVNDAIQFISGERNPAKPFFMYLGIPAPHDPRWSLKKFRDMYDEHKMPLPENYQPVHPWDIGSMTVRDERLEAWPRTKEAIQRHIFDYYSTITAMDFDFGRLIEVLDKQNLTDNTIIIFSSDQGLSLGQHGLMGKQNIYEGTMKVPFFMKGPGVPKGQSDAFVYLHDVLPTLCDIAQTEIPDSLDGKSFYGILTGKEQQIRDNAVLAYMDTQRSIRDKQWKLIRFPKIGKTVLYNLDDDPNEIRNLADEPQHKQKVNELTEKLKKECKTLGDQVDLFSESYEPAEFVAPIEKLPTPYPAGGLAPEDPAFVEE